MKHLFFLLIFAFTATYLQAQDSIRVTLYGDSAYLIENIYFDDSNIPTRVDVVRANGATELTNYFTGIANQAFADYEQANRRYRETEKHSRATLATVNARFAALGLPSYLDQQAARLGGALQGDYTWQAPGIATPVSVTVNANLRFNPGTGVHQIRVLKDGFLRVTQSGVTLAELFLVNRRYVSFDGKYVLRLPNSVQGLGK
jgi:hypothetical protein